MAFSVLFPRGFARVQSYAWICGVDNEYLRSPAAQASTLASLGAHWASGENLRVLTLVRPCLTRNEDLGVYESAREKWQLGMPNHSLERTGGAGGLPNEGVGWARVVSNRRSLSRPLSSRR